MDPKSKSFIPRSHWQELWQDLLASDYSRPGSVHIPVKDLMVSIFSFTGHVVSITGAQLHCGSMKAAIDNI